MAADIWLELLTGILIIINLAVLAMVRRRPGATPAKAAPALPAEDLARLEKATQAAFEKAVQQATADFNKDLAGTSERLNQLILRLTTNVVENELVAYRQSLEAARANALQSLQQMQQAVNQQQQKLQTDMEAELNQRRDQLIQKLDQRLGEAVAAYLVESLGQGADLGAQRRFMLEALERNKAAIKKDLTNEL